MRMNFSWAEGSRKAQVFLQLPPLDPEARQVTLIIPMEAGEEVRIAVPLVSLAELGEWSEMAHTVTAGGVTVSAAAQFSEDTRVSLFILPGSGRGIDSIGRFFGEGIPAGRFVSLSGEAGEAYGFLRQGQAGWQPNYFELYFEGVKDDGGEAGKKEITFSIPVLLLKEEGRAGVKDPVLRQEESWELNQVVTLASPVYSVEGPWEFTFEVE